MKVLITGAAGNLGQKLTRHLLADGRYQLTLLDRRADDTGQILTAELAAYDPAWVRYFHGQNVIVHLAADADVHATWQSLQANNVDALLNVFRAAVENRVDRVVFASSVRAFQGYMDSRTVIRHDRFPSPVELYAATKVFGERLGKSLADQYGMSVICLRIGAVWLGDNSPKGKRHDLRRQWLSTRDFCQAVEKAIWVSEIGFAALFVTSDNEDKPFDLSETWRALGYEPQDGVRATRRSLSERIRYLVKRQLRRLLRSVETAH